MADEESGLDELMRLSQQFTKQEEERQAKERQRAEQGKKVQGVLQGLKALNVDMALTQLQGVAEAETIKAVAALKTKPNTEDLRDTITALADKLERQLASLASADADKAPLADAMRTLNIITDLYFSLH